MFILINNKLVYSYDNSRDLKQMFILINNKLVYSYDNSRDLFKKNS